MDQEERSFRPLYWPQEKVENSRAQLAQKIQHKQQVQQVWEEFEEPIEQQVDPNKEIQLKNFETSKIRISRLIIDAQKSKINVRNIPSLHNKDALGQIKQNYSKCKQEQQVIPCPFCAVQLKLIQLDHIDTCPEGKECFYCKQRYPKSLSGSHLIICPQRQNYYAKRQLEYKKVVDNKKLVVDPRSVKRQNPPKRWIQQKQKDSPVRFQRKNHIQHKPATQSKPQFKNQAVNKRLTYNKHIKPSIPQLNNRNKHQDRQIEPKIDLMALQNASMLRQQELKGLTSQEIQEIGAEIYFKRGGNETDCLVCTMQIDEGESIMRLPCNHIFHQECLRPWLQSRSRCPTCKTRVLE